MKRMHVVLVCHAELYFGDSWALYKRFLIECAQQDTVVFSTAAEAAADLRENGL